MTTNITDKIMECVDLMASQGATDIDPRAFDHFRIYDPGLKKMWYDTDTKKLIEIDKSVTAPDGEPCPPMDCVLVRVSGELK